MLGRKPPAGPARQACALTDADKDIVGEFHVTGLETTVIRRHQRQAGFQRRIKKDRLGPLLGSKPVALQFNIDASRKCRCKGGKPVADKVRLAIGGGAGHKSVLGPAGQQDQPLPLAGEAFKRNHRIITALDRQKRSRVQPAQRCIAGLILRQKDGFAIATRVTDKAFKPDDRLNAGPHHDLREFQRTKHVLAVSDRHGRLGISPCQGCDFLNS